MKYIVYGHQSVTPLVVVLLRLTWRFLVRLFPPGRVRAGILRYWRRVVFWMAVLASLAIQAIMLHLLSELVELCIDLMEVWAELAAKHLEIQLDRT